MGTVCGIATAGGPALQKPPLTPKPSLAAPQQALARRGLLSSQTHLLYKPSKYIHQFDPLYVIVHLRVGVGVRGLGPDPRE